MNYDIEKSLIQAKYCINTHFDAAMLERKRNMIEMAGKNVEHAEAFAGDDLEARENLMNIRTELAKASGAMAEPAASPDGQEIADGFVRTAQKMINAEMERNALS